MMFSQSLLPAVSNKLPSIIAASRVPGCRRQFWKAATSTFHNTSSYVQTSLPYKKPQAPRAVRCSILGIQSNPIRELHATSLLCNASVETEAEDCALSVNLIPTTYQSVIFFTSARGMIAFRYYPKETTAVRETLPIPTPKPDEVIVKILAGGVCHSDLGILDPSGSTGEWTNPFTLGHEGAGVIHSLGSQATRTHPNLKEGTYVAILGPDPCFKATCGVCSIGKDNICSTTDQWYGIGRDGAWAEYCAVRAACAIPVPADTETIPPPIAAIATDAILTPYHALKTCVALQPGQTVAIIGCGGLGHNAIQIAKNVLHAGTIIGIDTRSTALDGARQAGASIAVTPDDIDTITRAPHVKIDTVVDFVGNQRSFDTALAIVKPAGTIHIVGLMAPSIQLQLMPAVLKDLTVQTSFWGTKAELVEVLDAVAQGKIKPLVGTRPLEDCLQVLKELHGGQIKGRIALIP